MVVSNEPTRLAQLPDYWNSPRKYGILLADDEECMRGMLKIALRQQGFAVWVAASGEQALELYRQQQLQIDLVLLDVRMPGGDGPQTLAALREINPQICCCFMSGDFGKYAEAELRALGAVAVFQKPFSLDEVAQELQELARRAA